MSKRFAPKLSSHGFRHSLSHRGNSCDNAIMESSDKARKRKMPIEAKFESRPEARQETILFIEMYDDMKRPHS